MHRMSKITRPVLAADLKRLGVREGDCLTPHSPLSGLGCVEGGAKTVVEALLTCFSFGRALRLGKTLQDLDGLLS